MKSPVLSIFFLILFLLSAQANFASFQVNGAGAPVTCDVTKNIVSDYGAVGSGLVDDSPAFSSFRTFAISTYQPSNPGKTICLTVPPGTYFFGTFLSNPLDGITNLVINGSGATFTNAINLVATSNASAGTNVLTFASVPPGVATAIAQFGHVVNDTNKATLDGSQIAISTNCPSPCTTITLDSNIAAPGVSIGDHISIGGGGYSLGTAGMQQTVHGLLQTVTAGTTTLNLSTPSDYSKFTVNQYSLIGGVDMQGNGQPINVYIWERVLITNISTDCPSPCTFSTITTQSPVKYSYKTTWPAYDPDLGGPAMLWPMAAGWGVTHVYNGLTFYQWDGIGGTLLNARGKSITFNNCSAINWAVNLSEQQDLTFNNCDFSAVNQIEADKLFENVTFTGGVASSFQFQSGSMNDSVTFNNFTVNRGIAGTPGTWNINNSTIDIAAVGSTFGVGAYGHTQTINCTNSSIGGGMQLGGQSQDLSVVGVTMSSGQVTVPRTVMHPVLWAMPGVDVYWTAPDKYIPPLFTVTDLTGDVTNTYVQTSLAGGFPSVPNKSVINAIANTVNFSGCTGNTTVKDLSQAGARNARPFTYSNRIYTCTGNVAAIQAANPGVPVIDMNSLPNEIAPSGGPPGPGPLMSRAIVSLTANVSVADTGANGTVDFHIGGQFDNYPVYNGSGTGTTWAPTINLKKTGTRTYIGSGGTGTWSGTCLAGSPGNADSCPTLTNPSYFSNVMPPFTSVNLSGETAGQCPVVTVTIQTN